MFSLFRYLVSTEPTCKEIDPFDIFAHYTPWQKFCRKILFTPLYKQRYIDHNQLQGYKEKCASLKGAVARYAKHIDKLLEINARNEGGSFLKEGWKMSNSLLTHSTWLEENEAIRAVQQTTEDHYLNMSDVAFLQEAK